MSSIQRLAGPRFKVKRANFHIQELEREIRAFHDSKPYRVDTQKDPNAQKLRYYIARAKPVPVSICPIVGDVLFNLRSALDHLAHQFLLIGPGGGAAHDVYFPIYNDAAQYAAQSKAKVKGLPQAAIDFIDSLKPYKGGNDALWRLNKLNNIDKHRLLIAAGGSYQSFDVGPMIRGALAKSPDRPKEWGGVPSLSLFLKTANKLCPLKVGDVLLTVAEAEPNPDVQFTFEVSLHEPGIVEPEPVLKLLSDLSSAVDSILDAAAPLLD